MSRGGVAVDRVVACPGIGSGQASDALVSIVGASGDYHAVRVASDRVQFARTFRPTWATVLGICLIPLALVGIVFFFVKTTETCIATVEADHRGTRIRLSGRLDAEVLQRLLANFDDPAGAARDAAAAAAVGAPVDSANPAPPAFPSTAPPVPMAPPSGTPVPMAPPSGTPVPMAPPTGPVLPSAGPPPAPPIPPTPAPTTPPADPAFASPGPPYPPVPQPAAPVAPAAGSAPSFPPPSFTGPAGGPSAVEQAPSAGWVPVWERDQPESAATPATGGLGFDPSSTIIVPRQRTGGPAVLRAVLDDGSEVDLSAPVLLGRDPSTSVEEGDAQLVAVADPERTVSKTHLKVELLGGVVLVTDRGSTNGSALVAADGSESELEAGSPTEVPAGVAVRFGTRTLRVLSTGAIAPTGSIGEPS